MLFCLDVVRRRTWHREIRKGVAPPTANPLRTSSVNAPGGRNLSIGSATAPAASGTGNATGNTGRRKPMFAKK